MSDAWLATLMLSQKLHKRSLVSNRLLPDVVRMPCASNADAHAMGWSPGSNEESLAKGSNASSVPLNPPSRLLLRLVTSSWCQSARQPRICRHTWMVYLQMQSPWPKNTSGEVGAAGSDLGICIYSRQTRGPRGWQQYKAMVFLSKTHCNPFRSNYCPFFGLQFEAFPNDSKGCS